MHCKRKKIEHNPDWQEMPDIPHRLLIIGNSRSRKTNSLFNLKIHQPDFDNIFLYAKDPYEAKYQMVIKKLEGAGIKHFSDSEAFIEDLTILKNN